jgi:hypothetical protein
MLTKFATLLVGLLEFLNKHSGTLVALVTFLAGKRVGKQEVAADQAREDAALAQDWLENRDSIRTPDDTLKRMQNGRF